MSKKKYEAWQVGEFMDGYNEMGVRDFFVSEETPRLRILCHPSLEGNETTRRWLSKLFDDIKTVKVNAFIHGE